MRHFILTEHGLVPREDETKAFLRKSGDKAAGEAARLEAGEGAPGGALRRGARLSRREFLARGGRALLSLSVLPALLTSSGCRSDVEEAASALQEEATVDLWSIPGLSPEVTPVGDFYTVSKNLWDPTVDARNWMLEVGGLVHRPYVIGYDQLTRNGPTVTEYVTLTCISNPVGGLLTGNARWRGVRMRDLLQAAGVMEGAVDVVMEAHDEYTDSIPIEKAMHPDTLVVWEMNGAPLTPKHGFPARVIVPGIYGMKNVKWLRRITVVDYDYKGFWQQRGWSDPAPVKTWSRIDVPRAGRLRAGGEVVIAGLAYAGDRGVQAVEVSTDGGATWRPAQLKEPLGPYAWRLWAVRWTPERGSHRIAVRATDGTGAVQLERRTNVLPDGAEGHHSVSVTAS